MLKKVPRIKVEIRAAGKVVSPDDIPVVCHLIFGGTELSSRGAADSRI